LLAIANQVWAVKYLIIFINVLVYTDYSSWNAPLQQNVSHATITVIIMELRNTKKTVAVIFLQEIALELLLLKVASVEQLTGCIRIPESQELQQLQELRRNIVKYSIQHIQHMQKT